jgi:signal transduction histidine kinase
MAPLRSFFDLNRELISFGYGLVFFVLGLAIALQSRRNSRLELARSLSWLAAFGFAHAAYEWGELFAPMQEAYLSPEGIQGLHALHLLVLALSFICLLEFGVALLRPLGRGQWLHPVVVGVLLAYVLIMVVLLPRWLPNPHEWHNSADAVARYLIAFPGALLSAYGLREQAFRQIAPLQTPHIIRTLRAGGIALALYAVFGGLIPPPVPFFPGRVLNMASFEAALALPTLVVNSAIGLVLSISIIRALEVFEVETDRIIEGMEQQQILATERERLGRELHDGAIQTVYTAGLLVESAQHLAEPGSPVAARLDRAMAVLNDAIGDLRRSLSELRGTPGGGSEEPLAAALRRLAEDPRFRSMVDVTLALDLRPDDCLSPVRTSHVLAIVNEALSNAVRHAHATRVDISAAHTGARLQVAIQDNGVGLPAEAPAGYGLRNMRDRARLLGGQVLIANTDGKGARVELDAPWKDER